MTTGYSHKYYRSLKNDNTEAIAMFKKNIDGKNKLELICIQDDKNHHYYSINIYEIDYFKKWILGQLYDTKPSFVSITGEYPHLKVEYYPSWNDYLKHRPTKPTIGWQYYSAEQEDKFCKGHKKVHA